MSETSDLGAILRNMISMKSSMTARFEKALEVSQDRVGHRTRITPLCLDQWTPQNGQRLPSQLA